MENIKSEFIIFKSEDNKISVDVRLEDETVWLSQDQIANLFGKARSTIAEHIKNVFTEGELIEEVACRNFRHTTKHGAIEKATSEYKKYQQKTLSEAEKNFLESLKLLENKAK